MTNAGSALWEALRARLLAAYGAETIGPGAGVELRAACDRLGTEPGAVPPERLGPLRAWRRTLAGFERLDEDARRVEVARGLRLCRAAAGAAPAAPAPPPVAVTLASERNELPSPSGGGAGGEGLQASVRTIPGIGPALAARLAERELETVEDLAWFVPRRYDDLRRALPLGEALAAEPGTRVTLVGEVASVKATRWRRRFVAVELRDPARPDARLRALWFNVHGGLAARFAVGRRVVLSGPLRLRDGEAELVNPELLGGGDDDGEAATAAAGIRPRYAEVEGVAPAILRRSCREAAARAAPLLADGLPPGVAARLELPPLAEALACLHAPPASLGAAETAALLAAASPWHRRLAFDELFFIALAVSRRRAERLVRAAVPCAPPGDALAEVEAALPFALTGAQRRAIAVLAGELAGERPMNRLLQGDVGSGKTAVAFAAAHLVLRAGRQVALMAPTEILAEQHLQTLGPWARALGHRIALLTASTPRGVRESTLGLVAAGATNLVVGTHSLLAERLAFPALGLVIIDEQHRFGVAQRARLRGKGEDEVPHLLVMTATPIPRTLALTFYGDLDATVLDELPPGRTPPETRVLSGVTGRRDAYKRLRRELERGARAFVVCPLVEAQDDVEDAPEDRPADAVGTAARLAAELAPARVGLAHGRLTAPEREEAMRRLRAGEIDVLVATTVIEVGVDVPSATVMLIEDADRFGLAQLHQLRGRVGRGGGRSVCLLLVRHRAQDSDATRRLTVMAETGDGFKIAEEDLAIRGPGEVLGVRQAGLPKLRFGDLGRHAALVAEARREVDRLIAVDPLLERPEHAAVAAVLAARIPPSARAGEGG